jgi:hypothetical protein
MKIGPAGAELFHADKRTDGRTDGHDEASSRFLQFCERTENRCLWGATRTRQNLKKKNVLFSVLYWCVFVLCLKAKSDGVILLPICWCIVVSVAVTCFGIVSPYSCWWASRLQPDPSRCYRCRPPHLHSSYWRCVRFMQECFAFAVS